jgi:hypothetical protein
MEEWKISFLKELEKAGKKEKDSWLESLEYHQHFQIKSPKEFLTNSKLAIKKLVGSGFFTGRGDWLSDAYLRCLLDAFNSEFATTDKLSEKLIVEKLPFVLEGFERRVKETLIKKDGVPYKIRERDKKSVESFFKDFLVNLGAYDFNPIKFAVEEIKKGNLKKVFEAFEKIYGWGKKVSYLTLRDIVLFFELEKYLKDEDYALLFPVDTHVRNMFYLLFPEMKGKKDEEIIAYSVKICKRNKINPMLLNIGLWSVRSHAGRAIDILIDRLSKM